MASGQGATLTLGSWTIKYDRIGVSGDWSRQVLERMPLDQDFVTQEADGHAAYGGVIFEGDPETISGVPPIKGAPEALTITAPLRDGQLTAAEWAGNGQLVEYDGGEWAGGENAVARGRIIWTDEPTYTAPT